MKCQYLHIKKLNGYKAKWESWLGGSVGWSIISCITSCRFDSCSGHVGAATNWCFSHINVCLCLCLSLFLPLSQINTKYILRWGLKKAKWELLCQFEDKFILKNVYQNIWLLTLYNLIHSGFFCQTCYEIWVFSHVVITNHRILINLVKETWSDLLSDNPQVIKHYYI